MALRIAGAAILAQLWVSGCAGDKRGLDGNWLAVGAEGPGAVEPEGVTLRIKGDKVTGSDGVNAYQGHLETSGGRMIVSELAVTAVGTVGEAGKGPAFFHALLQGKPRFVLTGDTLTLSTDDDRSLVLTR